MYNPRSHSANLICHIKYMTEYHMSPRTIRLSRTFYGVCTMYMFEYYTKFNTIEQVAVN